jgi:hypothetical protein
MVTCIPVSIPVFYMSIRIAGGSMSQNTLLDAVLLML